MATVLITGANRGLGLELARQYGEEGWQVLACSRHSSAPLDALIERHDNVHGYPLDVADGQSVEDLASGLAGVPIDVLINNAGVYGKVGLAEGGIDDQQFGHNDYDDWLRILNINTLGPMRMAEAFVEHVAASEQKKIVTFSSIVGSNTAYPGGGMYRYRSSKAAVNAVMKSMSVDLADRGILAVAMHPGWARTDMGGPRADIDSETSISGVRQVIADLKPDQLGSVIAYDGSVLPY